MTFRSLVKSKSAEVGVARGVFCTINHEATVTCAICQCDMEDGHACVALPQTFICNNWSMVDWWRRGFADIRACLAARQFSTVCPLALAPWLKKCDEARGRN